MTRKAAARRRRNGSSSPTSASPPFRAATACMSSCVRSTSAKPVAGIALRLVARDNEVLAKETTGADGHVRFEPGLARGTGGRRRASSSPRTARAITASSICSRRPSISPIAASRAARRPQPLDAYVFTERGVYRSGEKVFITALLRDDKGIAKPACRSPSSSSVPTASNIKRQQIDDQGDGGRSFIAAAALRRRQAALGASKPMSIRRPRRSARRASSSRIMFPNGSTSP